MKKLTFLFYIFLISCTNATYDDIIENNSNLILKWNKGYEDDNLANTIIG